MSAFYQLGTENDKTQLN